MIRGLYTSGWSMLANSKKMDVVSNNLANANTNAYKKDTVVFESFPSVLTKRLNDTPSGSNPSGRLGNMELGSDIGEVFTYYNQGQLMKTDNTFDMAFQNSGTAFFSIEVPDQEGNAKEFYTRDGSFTVNSDNQLVTKEGYLVKGEEGPITLNGDIFSVDADGTVIQNGEIVAKLLIKDFANPESLRKYGSNLVSTTDDTVEQEFKGTVVQGYLEQSNINIVREMIDMISVTRAYEANQKVLQAQDSTLEKAVNQIASLR